AYDFQMLKNPETNLIPKTAPMEAYKAALREQNSAKARSVTLPNITTEARGPGNYGGRVRALDFDSRNKMIGVSGGVSGGIFRTTNGGDTWTNVTPPGQIHNLTTIAQDKSSGSENIWYAGGGEQIGNSARVKETTYLGNGVWKSTDNGLTWTLLSSTTGTLEKFDSDWDFIHRIIVDPTNGYVYAGNSGGVYRSTDKGVSWTKVLTLPFERDILNVVEIVRASNGTFYAGVAEDGIYSSTTGDVNSWSKFASLIKGDTRVVLATAPSNANIVYAMIAGKNFFCNSDSSNVYLRRYTNRKLDGNYDEAISICTTPALKLDSQKGYNLTIAVRPNNENEIFIGGERLYRFTTSSSNAQNPIITTGTYEFAGGDQGNPTATNVHVDHHYLLFTDDNTLWSTNDGGIRRADVSIAPVPHTIETDVGHTNGGFSWTNRNAGLITYQFYQGDITPNVGSNMVGGAAQDNANNIIAENTTNGTELGGADGTAFAIISGTNTTNFKAIIGIQNGTIYRRTSANSETGGGYGEYITPQAGTQPFKGYILLDGDNTEHLYYPARVQTDAQDRPISTTTSSLYRTRIASTVPQNPTNNAATGWENMTLTGMETGHNITTMGLTRGSGYTASDANRKLYIGTDQGKVYRTVDPAFATSLALTDITPTGLTGYVSDVSVNPNNDKELMVVLSNYGISNIYHTTDATASPVVWTQVEGAASGAVAKASIRSAMIADGGANTTLYMVGTSTGLYGTTTLSGATTAWERIGTNEIAYALCVDMRLRTADNKVSLATHGNGLYYLSLPSNQNNCVATLTLNDTPIASNTYQSSNTITSTGTVASGTTVVMDATNSVTLNANFMAVAGSNFTAKIGGCTATTLTEDEFVEVYDLIEITPDATPQTTLDFSLYPSPASGEVTVNLFLEEPNEAVVTLHSSMGNMVKVIQNNTNLDSGHQQLSFNASDLKSGLYYVVISTPSIRKSQKLLVQAN
ncbi:MAG: 3-coathanger stack domain-containing protein, partial [Saprospiraceae bacterium]